MMIHDGLVWSLQSGDVVVDLYFVAGLFIGFAALGLVAAICWRVTR